MISQQPITDRDLPALHNSANNASTKAQKQYLFWFRLNLSFVVLGSLLSLVSMAVSKAIPSATSVIAVFSGCCFIISLLITLFIQNRKFERNWYAGRAVAESVKTLTWRYMTCAGPFNSELSAREADEKFSADLSTLMGQRKFLSSALDPKLENTVQITDRMKEIRGFSMGDRKDFYAANRLDDQIKWYGGKAEFNKKRETLWFTAIFAAQIAAITATFVYVGFSDSVTNVASIFATVAAALLSWLQVKKHQELAQSYSLAAQELGVVKTKVPHVSSDEELSTFVNDAENAMSREHTMWIARRDQS
jgi:hypothetical protein